MKYFRVALVGFVVVCFWIGNGVSFAETLTWQTSKATAISIAKEQGKKVLLLGGRETCGNTMYMKNTACESTNPAIKTLIEKSFVPWFCDVDNSDEWVTYASGLGSFTLPVICVIDPNNDDEYLDRTTNFQEPQDFYSRLLQYKTTDEVDDECVNDDRYDEGYEAGKKYCKENPVACGIVSEEPVCSQVITYAKPQVLDCWIEFPTSCDIPKSWTATSKKQENLCGELSYNAGKEYCKENPTACGIDIEEGFTQADLDASKEAGKAECVNNPEACGINLGTSTDFATLTTNMEIRIARLVYAIPGANPIDLWANFEFLGQNNEGEFLWKLSNFGQNK